MRTKANGWPSNFAIMSCPLSAGTRIKLERAGRVFLQVVLVRRPHVEEQLHAVGLGGVVIGVAGDDLVLGHVGGEEQLAVGVPSQVDLRGELLRAFPIVPADDDLLGLVGHGAGLAAPAGQVAVDGDVVLPPLDLASGGDGKDLGQGHRQTPAVPETLRWNVPSETSFGGVSLTVTSADLPAATVFWIFAGAISQPSATASAKSYVRSAAAELAKLIVAWTLWPGSVRCPAARWRQSCPPSGPSRRRST